MRDIPVCLQVGSIADPHIGANTLYFLYVPEGEGVIITIRKKHGVRFAGFQIIRPEVASKITEGTIMIIPIFRGHPRRNRKRKKRSNNSSY
ncbi:MAG: hypothetical protein LBU03_02220 [Tannerellaceae bacterium]|nr:hypothetical protein [Tannerellaceae bacterium]